MKRASSFIGTLATAGLFVCLASLPAYAAGQASKPARTAKPSAKPQVSAGAAAGEKSASGKSQVTEKSLVRLQATEEDKTNFGEEKKFAVIVAPKYAGSKLAPLRWTLADATQLGQELERQKYEVRVIVNDEAYAENIRNVLKTRAKNLEGHPNATFLFAFSGHGFGLPDGNYLVTSDLTIPGEDGPLPDRIKKLSISVEEIENLMKSSGARRKVMLIDACRTDPGVKGGEKEALEKFQAAEGFAILLSTRFGDASYEDAALGHGLFTNYVLEGLRGKAAKNGYVTFYDLSKFVTDSVETYANKIDRTQKPFTMGERSGDFLLGTSAPPTPEQIAGDSPAVASKIDNEAQVLVSKELNQRLIAVRDGDSLNLYEAGSLMPYATGLRPQPAKDGYQRFDGPGPQNQLVQIVFQMDGKNVKSASGRLGRKCAEDKPCGTTPEEMAGELPRASSGTNKADDCAKLAKRAKQAIDIFTHGGKKSDALDKTSQSCEQAKLAQNDFDGLKKYTWTPFSLSSPLSKAVADRAMQQQR